MNVLKNARFCDVYKHNTVSIKDYPECDLCEVVVFKKAVRQKGYEDERGSRAAEYLELREMLEEYYAILEDREPLHPQKRTTEEESKERSLRRIKSRALDIAFSNRFQYWVTFTVNPDLCDRYSLDDVIKKFHTLVKNRNDGVRSDRHIKYMLFPEQHQDGAWHLHGFILGLRRDEVKRNEHGYLTIPLWSDNIGFDNVTFIGRKCADEYRRIVGYTAKYAEKGIQSRGKYSHAYYISRGLKTATARSIDMTEEIDDCMIGAYENEYIKKKSFTGSYRESLLSFLQCLRRGDEEGSD